MKEDMRDLGPCLALAGLAAARVRRAAETRLRQLKLTFAQYSALAVLAERTQASQAEIAQAMETDSTTAMVLRGSLERKGLVRRGDPQPGDARVKRLALTAEGARTFAAAAPLVAAAYADSAGLFSEAELSRLLPLLERLAEFGKASLAAAAPEKAKSGEPKRRGRPPKPRAEGEADAPKRPRGRPPKAKQAAEEKPAARKGRKPAAEEVSEKPAAAGRAGKKAAAPSAVKSKPAAPASAKAASKPKAKPAAEKPAKAEKAPAAKAARKAAEPAPKPAKEAAAAKKPKAAKAPKAPAQEQGPAGAEGQGQD